MTVKTFNTILTDEWRKYLESEISILVKNCPEIMARKYERANVQQAFTYSMSKEMSTKDSKILCVGCFEDTAFECLKVQGYNITGIDPAVNMDLNKFFSETMARTAQYHTIFSTSVIEHVADDEKFLDQICQLLVPGGHGIITCDFKEGWKEEDPKPGEDYRLYTEFDLTVRLHRILKLNNCSLIGKPDYNYPPDFDYGIHKYSFETLMFRKNG